MSYGYGQQTQQYGQQTQQYGQQTQQYAQVQQNQLAALKIVGRTGKCELINGTYEPLPENHNGRPVWCARSVSSLYVYHTGKARWVISKRIDEGARCYAFIKGTGSDPTEGEPQVVICDADQEWRADPAVVLTQAPSSSDKFVQLRTSLEKELKEFGMNDITNLRQFWKRLDFNGNNIVSLAEIDKWVVEMVAGGQWPAWLNNKPALMRAYKKTILKDGDGDDWVEKKEFHALCLNLFWFNKLWQIFDVMDGDDRRIDLGEFIRGIGALGLHLSEPEARAEFAKIDLNGGGQVLFVEFCAYIRKRVNPDANPAFDADVISGTKCSVHMRKSHGNKATQTHYVSKKNLREFEDLEQKLKADLKDRTKIKELWNSCDFNGNNIVSLAEIDKLVVEQYPLLNHKPALMRAYKATIGEGNGDDWVQKKEFKNLIGNLFYFNKLFWLFENVDGDADRRLNYQEFKKCLVTAGAKMNEQDMRADFQKVDRNGGGIILFDEFCLYFTQKACPEALGALTD